VGRTDTGAAQAGQQEGEVTVADVVAHQFLADKAEAIRTTARNAVFEIGKHLTEAREKCRHGTWLAWLHNEFHWSHTTADKYMAIYAAMDGGKLQPKLQFGLSISSLALLAAPSTPETAVDEVVEQAKVGRKVPHSRVKAMVAEHKPEPKPGAPPSSPPQAPVPAPPAPQRFDVPTTGPIVEQRVNDGERAEAFRVLEIARRTRARDPRSDIVTLCNWIEKYAVPMVAVAREARPGERNTPTRLENVRENTTSEGAE
jgi:Protein of unknown function (DUF3102)